MFCNLAEKRMMRKRRECGSARGGSAERKHAMKEKATKTEARKHWIVFAAVHAGIGILVLLLPLYGRLVQKLSAHIYMGCFLRDFFGILCSVCGGTHSVKALLRGDFAEAWHTNAGVVCAIAAAISADGVILVNLIRGRKRPFPHGSQFALAVLLWLLLFGVVRNFF